MGGFRGCLGEHGEWRTRSFEHCSEWDANDGVDTMVFTLIKASLLHKFAMMFKTDIKSAFRGVPIAAEHLWATGIVYWYNGECWFTQQYTMPFGAINAVWSWHRCSNVILA